MLQINFDPFPVLETERLILRRIILDDANDYFAMRSNVDAMKYICKPIQRSVDETIQQIYRVNEMVSLNEGIGWAVCLKHDSKMIGTASFHKIDKDHHRGEIGYMLQPAFWRQGIIGEAVRALIKYGFDTLKFHSIEAHIDPNNVASEKTLLKHGFVKEAHFKENYLFDGRYLDTGVYSLLTPNK